MYYIEHITARSLASIGVETPNAFPPSLTGKRVMCERCDEIDGRIEHYRKLAKDVSDKRALEAIDSMVADMKVQKRALHPEQ
jgi:hypothetical protein